MNLLNDTKRKAVDNTLEKQLGTDYLKDYESGILHLNSVPVFVDFNPTYQDIETEGDSWESGYSYGVFKKYIDLCIYTISYSFKIDERIITLNFNTENVNMNYIFNCFKQAYSWLHIVNKYGTSQCSKKLTINI